MAIGISKQARAILGSLLETFEAIDKLGSIENAVAEQRMASQRIADEQVERERLHQQRVADLVAQCEQKVLAAAQISADAKRDEQSILQLANQQANEIIRNAEAERQRKAGESLAIHEDIMVSQAELARLTALCEDRTRDAEAGTAKLAAIREALAKFQV